MKAYKAPAKVNLFLKVIGKREDGFHELLMLMEKIPLYDVLHIEKKDKGIEIESLSMSIDKDNLIYKAAENYFQYFKLRGGLFCQLEKNIPLGAGLGGGSSDAATTLIALSDIYKKGTNEELHRLALELGSDVPFFLKKRSCIARGRGEILEEVQSSPQQWILLAKPSYGISTADVYKNLLPEDIEANNSGHFFERYNKGDPSFMTYSVNDLEKPAFRLRPELQIIKNNLGDGALMSGSGTTFFKFCSTKKEAEVLKERLPKDLKTWVLKGNK